MIPLAHLIFALLWSGLVLCFGGRFCLPGLFVCICYHSTLPTTYLYSFSIRIVNSHSFTVYRKPTWYQELGLAPRFGHYAAQSLESASINKEDLFQQCTPVAEVWWTVERNTAPWAGCGGAREGPQWEKQDFPQYPPCFCWLDWKEIPLFLPKICYWDTSVFKSKLKVDLNYFFKLRNKWNCLRILIQITVYRWFFQTGLFDV